MPSQSPTTSPFWVDVVLWIEQLSKSCDTFFTDLSRSWPRVVTSLGWAFAACSVIPFILSFIFQDPHFFLTSITSLFVLFFQALISPSRRTSSVLILPLWLVAQATFIILALHYKIAIYKQLVELVCILGIITVEVCKGFSYLDVLSLTGIPRLPTELRGLGDSRLV